eukprot:Plantae.Rhodophyta-Purpureofilum_apyrenoidigerum.ctg2712.p1 GENE.Plantae.Rhodophyta-Purpureofilum_apyrenoidigerum.ctg2712~~Plantae.Rhodophyta-Purpureofilum_apyrenoidigerum.ctg2712.p1  ORF type:complete len:508 (+),score=52.81 Plantae.Rhodophyta-Purpureofilum_apyrenoidigerum.ctg2712:163-1686(+)
MVAFQLPILCSAAGPGRASSKKRAIVVGGGVGGIVTAGRLAQNGFNVTVHEKNERLGGRLSETFIETAKGTYRFDTGPSLLLLPDVYRKTFADLGVDIDDVLDLVRVEPNYKVFRNTDELNISSDGRRMQEELERIEPGAFRAWERYVKSARAFFRGGFDSFIERDGLDILRNADVGSWLRMVVDGGNPLESHHTALSRMFKSETLVAAASFQDLYVGLSPYEAPAVFSLLGALEADQGVWYCKGGMVRIGDALVDIAKKSGVQFCTSSPIQSIVHDGTRASGVRFSDGSVEDADLIIVNADLPYARKALMNSRSADKSFRFSSGVVNLMLAVEDPCEGLQHHNVFFADDTRKSWDGIFAPGLHLPEDFNMYVHVPSKSDPSAAPSSCSSVMCLIPCGLLPGDEHALLQKARSGALKKLAKIFDISSVQSEAIYSPRTWATNFNLEKGAAFGIAHNLSQLAILRPSLQSDEFSNVFFVGASTRPGNGVPLVMISARLCAEKILSQVR